MGGRKRYALVGTGVRGIEMFAAPILTAYADVAELVGLYDVNPMRVRAARDLLRTDVPAFGGFEEMLREAHPDTVIVASKDSTHHGYVIGALHAGIDAITEKPMTTDDEKCRAILLAQRETGREVRVTFNYRYAPYFTKVKELLAAGVIGEVLSVDFHWYLDRRHGADYFRRWHRRMENSGGLLVHKATHHFDLVNWWLGRRPEVVAASGALLFYGPTREERGERCLTCSHKHTCEFSFDLTADEGLRRLYLDAEPGDGYVRDGCVFADEIDIYDTMSVMATYEGGARLTYSLNAYMPYEGMRAEVNGRDGRLEIVGNREDGLAGDAVTIHRPGKQPETIAMPSAEGSHGGGDERLLDDLFRGVGDDPLGHAAGVMDGAYSILVGVAANRSIADGGWVRIEDLLRR